jgi:hypothetical protein
MPSCTQRMGCSERVKAWRRHALAAANAKFVETLAFERRRLLERVGQANAFEAKFVFPNPNAVCASDANAVANLKRCAVDIVSLVGGGRNSGCSCSAHVIVRGSLADDASTCRLCGAVDIVSLVKYLLSSQSRSVKPFASGKSAAVTAFSQDS